MASRDAAAETAFEMKGAVSTLTVLRLLTTSLDAIEAQLKQKVAQLPQFFRSAPIVIDLEALDTAASSLSFGALAELLRENRLVPVAVRGIAESVVPQAAAAGFGLLKGGLSRLSERAEARRPPPADAPASQISSRRAVASEAPLGEWNEPAVESSESTPTAEASATEPLHGGQLVKQPVRSGQIIYAQQRDLVLLAAVNAGGEVIADGNIHVYAPLRGRALAGAHGDLGARIFCASLEAELVSVAGHYLRADEITADVRGRPAQVYLDAGQVMIRAM